MVWENTLAKEWSAGNRSGDRAGKTGLNEAEYEIRSASESALFAVLPQITA